MTVDRGKWFSLFACLIIMCGSLAAPWGKGSDIMEKSVGEHRRCKKVKAAVGRGAW